MAIRLTVKSDKNKSNQNISIGILSTHDTPTTYG